MPKKGRRHAGFFVFAALGIPYRVEASLLLLLSRGLSDSTVELFAQLPSTHFASRLYCGETCISRATCTPVSCQQCGTWLRLIVADAFEVLQSSLQYPFGAVYAHQHTPQG